MKRGTGMQNPGRVAVPEWRQFSRISAPSVLGYGLAEAAGRSRLSVNLVALLGFTVAAWIPLPWLAVAVWTLAGLIEWLGSGADSARDRWFARVGLGAPMRALLRSLGAAAALFSSGQPDAVWAGLGYVLVVFFVQLAWVLQPVLAEWVASTSPPLRYQPGAAGQDEVWRGRVRVGRRAIGTPAVLFGLELLALLDATLVLGLSTSSVLAILGLTVSAALAETALIYLGWTAWQAHALRRTAAGDAAALLRQLESLDPRYLLHLAPPTGRSGAAANPWLPAFEQTAVPGLIVVRQAATLAVLAPTTIPVVYAPRADQLARLITAGLRLACYLDQSAGHADLLQERRLRHVLIPHAVDDATPTGGNLTRCFDEVWLPGSTAADRYRSEGALLDGQRVELIGRPSLAGLDDTATGNTAPVVLYAPSAEGRAPASADTSLDTVGVRLVQQLLRRHPEVRVWFRPDPDTGLGRASMTAAAEEIAAVLGRAGSGHRVVTDDELPLVECLARTDVLIADVSGSGVDFLATGRPVITINSGGLEFDAFVAAYPSQVATYVVGRKLAELAAAIAESFGGDRLKDARAELAAGLLGVTGRHARDAFTAQLTRAAG